MGNWKIDAAHTDVSFSAKHMMITTVRGKFEQVEGELDLNEEDPTASHATFRVASASLNTGVEARDGHLRSADFFDVEKYPWITFVSTAVERKGSDEYRVTGDLTIRDVTKPVTFTVEALGIRPGMRGGRHAGLTATGKVSRKDWGLNWNVALEAGGWLVGDEIKLEIDVAADDLAGAQAA